MTAQLASGLQSDAPAVVWGELPVPPLGETSSNSASVVLYTCAFNSQIANRALAVLHDFAAQRGWTVAHELYDLAPLDTPRQHRTGWHTVEHELTSGAATGVVAPAEQEIAWYPGDRIALRAWLLGIPAFAVYPQAGVCLRTPDTAGAGALPSGASASVDRQLSRSYRLNPASLRQVRTDAITHLTVLGWPGNILTAVRVLAILTANAVVHATPGRRTDAQMTVVLAVTEGDELRIDVQDPSPGFRDSAAALNGEKGRGLLEARLLGAEATWSLAGDGRSKTVRARMVPGEVPA
ncbi:ATP-binding protein [Streptomyces sp. NPDC020801]|uniref:ATP-binding protein n=1 Tax=Streptomyces sp. NPDC020801 TaxID=3365093 RepID=UPI00379DB55D